jgi:hypothetical protein
MGFVETLLSETGFPSLKTIKLFGILGVSNWTRVSSHSHVPVDQHPLLSKLFSRPTIGRVEIHVGENRRLGGGHPAEWVLWEQVNQELVGLPLSPIVYRPLTNLWILVGGGEGRIWEYGGGPSGAMECDRPSLLLERMEIFKSNVCLSATGVEDVRRFIPRCPRGFPTELGLQPQGTYYTDCVIPPVVQAHGLFYCRTWHRTRNGPERGLV